MSHQAIDFKQISSSIELKIEEIFREFQSGMSEREDSRAFGAMIEKRITEKWQQLCTTLGYTGINLPGRRTIFDFACKIHDTLFGFDVKTKDLDSTRYSDGGVCAVGNLLKFLANDKGVFMIVEFGHDKSTTKNNIRDLEYIRVAPFHCLPENTYRIENLGTGQVRLNYTINQVWDEINWHRRYDDFFNIFCELAIAHYRRVTVDAENRIKSIQEFKNGGYKNFRFVK